MDRIVTNLDMIAFVNAALNTDADDFNVEAIVDDLQARYGTVDPETIDDEAFWAVVERHVKDPDSGIEPELYCGVPSRFFLSFGGGAKRQVTKAEWVAAERGAGFTGGRPGEPSTGGFGNGYVSGSIRMGADA